MLHNWIIYGLFDINVNVLGNRYERNGMRVIQIIGFNYVSSPPPPYQLQIDTYPVCIETYDC